MAGIQERSGTDRLVVIGALTLAAAVLLMATLHLVSLHNSIHEETESTGNAFVFFLSTDLGQTLAAVDRSLQGTIARFESGEGWLNNRFVTRTIGLLLEEALLQFRVIRSLSVAGPDGRILFSTNLRNKGLDISATESFRPQFGTGRTAAFAAPVFGRDLFDVNPRPGTLAARDGYFTVSRPIDTQGSRLIAVIGAKGLVNGLMRHVPQDGDRVNVYRYDGTILAALTEPANDRTIFEDFLPRHEAGNYEDEVSHDLVFFRVAGDLPVVVEYRMPHLRVAEKWRAAALIPTSIALLFLGAIGAGTVAIRQTLARERSASRHLAREQGRMRSILDTAAEGIVTIDESGTVLDFNVAAERIFGFAKAEIVGRPADLIMPPKIRGSHQALVDRYLKERKPRIIGTSRLERGVRRDGTEFDLFISISESLADGERLFTGIVRDVTEQRAIEAKFHTLFERTSQAFLLCTVGHISDCNIAALDLLGAKRKANLIGKDPYSLLAEVQPDGRSGVDAAADAAAILADGGSALFNWCLCRLDGDEVEVEATATVLPGGEEMLLSLHDVSARARNERILREARDAAEAAARAKTSFLAMMSHELRTPMTGVVGIVDLLEGTPLNREQRDLIFNLRRSARLLRTVLDDVLDFSKIEAGRLVIDPMPYQPAEILREVHDLFESVASEKGVILDTGPEPGFDPEAVHVGDPFRIRQILNNLVGNAVKFTDRGKVRIRLGRVPGTQEPPLLRFSVGDTGIGIAADRIPLLFQPFSQADAGIARRFGGTGLGLAICKRLVDSMDGEISCTSAIGEGSLFTFTLPSPVGEMKAGGKPVSAAASAVAAPPRHILLAEDNAVNRMLVEAGLRRRGHTVQAVENGSAAVEACRSGTFDVVFMDIHMPVMDGLAATAAIRALPAPGGSTPIYALTADVMSGLKQDFGNHGFNGYLSKPMDWHQIDQVLACLSAQVTTDKKDTSPSTQPSDLLDQEMVTEVVASVGADYVLELLQTFETTLKTYLTEAETAAMPEARRIAHSLKGSSNNLGMAKLGALAAEIESDPKRLATEIEDIAVLAHESLKALRHLIETEATLTDLDLLYSDT